MLGALGPLTIGALRDVSGGFEAALTFMLALIAALIVLQWSMARGDRAEAKRAA